jgi:hypothetical protein
MHKPDFTEDDIDALRVNCEYEEMTRKYALIIGNAQYIGPGLAQLTAPGNADSHSVDSYSWMEHRAVDGNLCARILLHRRAELNTTHGEDQQSPTPGFI